MKQIFKYLGHVFAEIWADDKDDANDADCDLKVVGTIKSKCIVIKSWMD